MVFFYLMAYGVHRTVSKFIYEFFYNNSGVLTAYKICRWKPKGGQKEDEEVKISKSNNCPIMLEMTNLHIKSYSRKPKLSTVVILSASEFSLHTNFVRGVAWNAYKSSNQLETFSNRLLAKFHLHLDTRNGSIAWKTLALCKFWLWLSVTEKRWLKNYKLPNSNAKIEY